MAGCHSGQNHGRSNLYSIHIGNLPSDTSRGELERLFGVCGQVANSDVPTPEKDRGFKFGFISYKNLESCQRAIGEMNNWLFRGRRIYVGLANQTRERLTVSERIKTEETDQPSIAAKSNSSYHGVSSPDDLQNLWRVKDTCNFINQEMSTDPDAKKQLDIERVLERIFRESGDRIPPNVESASPVECTLEDIKRHLRKSKSCKKDGNCSSDEHLQVFMESLKDILNTVSEFIVDTSQEISDSGHSSSTEERSPQRNRSSKKNIQSKVDDVSFEKKEQDASQFSYSPSTTNNMNKSVTINTASNNNYSGHSSSTEERSPQRDRASKKNIQSEVDNVSFEKNAQDASQFSYSPSTTNNINKSVTMNTASNNNCEPQSSKHDQDISDVLKQPATSDNFGAQSVIELSTIPSQTESPKRMEEMLQMMRRSSPESYMNKSRLEKLMSTLNVDAISDRPKYDNKVPGTTNYLVHNNLPKALPVQPSVNKHSSTKSVPIPFDTVRLLTDQSLLGEFDVNKDTLAVYSNNNHIQEGADPSRIIDSFIHGRDESPKIMDETKVGGNQFIHNYLPGFGRGRGRALFDIMNPGDTTFNTHGSHIQ